MLITDNIDTDITIMLIEISPNPRITQHINPPDLSTAVVIVTELAWIHFSCDLRQASNILIGHSNAAASPITLTRRTNSLPPP